MASVVGSVARTLAPLAEEAGVQIDPTGETEGVLIPGDEDQLRQVFTNLIENGVKYGGSGGRVQVDVTVSDNVPSLRGAGVTITVRDSGPGIAEQHIPRLTERFYRVDSHRSREMGGTGLGLAIVKHIITRHRGRMRIESKLGEGTAFIVILPLGQ